MSSPSSLSKENRELIGRVVADKFRIDAFLGQGAMGAVFRANQIALDRKIALKVTRRDENDPRGFSDAFLREARAASRLEHPNSVQILDYGEEPDGLLYIAMELLEGRDLYAVLQDEHPLSEARIVALLSQVLAALAVAHDQGIVHRDLKPENIMVAEKVDDEGNRVEVVKVCDFGIAKVLDGGASSDGRKQTTRGIIVGTPEYMSPEQAQALPVDARSDLYSVGVILFHLLTGKPPFAGETPIAIALQHITAPPPAIASLRAGVDPALEAICVRALAKDREGRFASARDMRAALRAVVAPVDVSAAAISRRSTEAISQRAITPRSQIGAAANPIAATLVAVMPPATPPTSSGGTLTGEVAAPSAHGTPTRARWLAALAGVAVVSIAIGLFSLRGKGSTAHGSEAPAIASAVASAHASTIVAAVTQGAAAPIATTTGAIAEPPVAPSSNAPPPVAPSKIDRGAPTLVAPAATTSAAIEDAGAPAPIASAAPTTDPIVAPVASATASIAPTAPTAPPTASAVVAPLPTIAAPTPLADTEIASASVSVTGATATNGVSGASVRASLNSAAFTRCYRDALKVRREPVRGSATLLLTIDESGRVNDARLDPPSFFPGVRACVEGAARGAQVKGVDTGDASARVTLSFTLP